MTIYTVLALLNIAQKVAINGKPLGLASRSGGTPDP